MKTDTQKNKTKHKREGGNVVQIQKLALNFLKNGKRKYVHVFT